MNKTISINISGILFHMDEFAYNRLNDYLNKLSSYFKNTHGGDEILADIQSRMAELFQQKLTASKQVITLADVDDVMNTMGSPETFMSEEDPSLNQNNMRGSETNNKNSYRRVFRDPDDKVLGGVCAGVANYFGFNPLWLRVLFAVLFFGFGTGFLLYVLLWIIIPKAKTTAEKLEMKGENVNIQNIEKSIKEELNDLKKRYADNSSNVKSGINKVFDFIIQMIKFAIKTVVKIAAILMLIVGCALLLALLSFLWNNDFFLSINDKVISGISLDTLLLNFFDTNQSLLLFKSGVLMFVGIPVIAIIFFGFKIIFKLNKPNKIFKISAVILWFVGILVCLISIKGMSKQFSRKFVQKSIVPVLAQNDTLYFDATINENFEDDFLSDEDEENEEEELMEEQLLSWSGWMLSKNDENYFYAFPYLDIEKSKSDSVELILQKSARGFSAINAESNAKQINYTISQSDSSIVLSSLFNVDKKQKWRNQRLKITLKVPVGKTIYLSGNLLHILRNAENVSSLSNKKMLEHKWMMTENGLVCVDCKSF